MSDMNAAKQNRILVCSGVILSKKSMYCRAIARLSNALCRVATIFISSHHTQEGTIDVVFDIVTISLNFSNGTTSGEDNPQNGFSRWVYRMYSVVLSRVGKGIRPNASRTMKSFISSGSRDANTLQYALHTHSMTAFRAMRKSMYSGSLF